MRASCVSSVTMSSPGKRARSVSRIACSQAQSTSVTRSISPLCATSIDCPKRAFWIAPAFRTACAAAAAYFQVNPCSRRKADCRMWLSMPTSRAVMSQRGTALLLALTAALLLFRLGAVPLVGPDEPRYARVAVEMHRSGDRVTPTLQGAPWLAKPALYYWLAGLAFSVLGETEVAARLPSVAAALLLVGAAASVGGRLYGRTAGLHAGFILATSILVFAYGRAATMDMLVAAAISAAIGLFAVDLLGIVRAPATIPAAYVFMALATLAKGPLGVLLPGMVVAGHMLATR